MPKNQLSPKQRPKLVTNPVLRVLLLAVGFLSIALGVLGIFLPVLPTTPFLLLAAACFIRTSPKFYDWLVDHPKLGKYVVYYLDGKGIPKKAKVYTLVVLWSTMFITAFIVLDSAIVRVILPSIGFLVSIYILRQPTLDIIEDSLPEQPRVDAQNQNAGEV